MKARNYSSIKSFARFANQESTYTGWRYVAKQVRKECERKPAKKGRKLLKFLNTDDFRKLYAEVDKA